MKETPGNVKSLSGNALKNAGQRKSHKKRGNKENGKYRIAENAKEEDQTKREC